MFIVDAHLDLAYNALRGRDVTLPAEAQTPDQEGIPSVGLPNLRAGEVRLICATIFCMPAIDGKGGYRNADEARDAGWQQMEWYRRQQEKGLMRVMRSGPDVAALIDEEHAGEGSPATGAILLLEGADPLRGPEDVPAWHAAGLRVAGLAWRGTRMAGGTGAPGPLTELGISIVHAFDRAGIIHDVSHLAEESFWQLLELSAGPVMASHSNCRAIVPTDRQLSDEMIEALVARGGVIGINFFDRFLLPPEQRSVRRASLDDVVLHVRHICDLCGNADHVGLGTDMDGGLGRDELPREIATSTDLSRVAEALLSAGFKDQDMRQILSQNWLRFFQRHLRA